MTVRALSDLLSRFSNARHGNKAQDLRDLAESVYPTLARIGLTNDVAAVLGVWERWGTEELTFTDEGRSVAVFAIASGFVGYNNATASRRLGEARVGISFDNGSTWDYGVSGRTEVRGADLRNSSVVAQHVRSGTPTADIKVRVELQQVVFGVAGDVDFQSGNLSALVIGSM